MVKKTKDVVDRAKESLPVKGNYTFRLEVKLADTFKSYCKAKNISMSVVVEQIMRETLDQNK